jgi:hypothetical protein
MRATSSNLVCPSRNLRDSLPPSPVISLLLAWLLIVTIILWWWHNYSEWRR